MIEGEIRTILSLANLLEIYEFAEEAEKWLTFFDFLPRKTHTHMKKQALVINTS